MTEKKYLCALKTDGTSYACREWNSTSKSTQPVYGILVLLYP